MRINNNLMAMNTHRQYGVNNANVSKSVEKLSSGFRINRAGDDAAGLAISEKMRAQIRGLSMASKNSQDAISLVQTAEGALQESHNILQRMRELAVQSASDTNETTIDRDALNKEFQALLEEIDDTASKTMFNEMGLIDGSFSAFKVAGNAVTGESTITKVTGGTLGFKVYANSLSIGATAAGVSDAIKFSIETTADASDNVIGATLTFTNAAGEDEVYTLKEGQTKLQFSNGVALEFAAIKFGAAQNLETIFGVTLDDGLVDSDGDISFTVELEAGLDFVVQTGANKGDELAITIDKMDAKTLGVWASDIASREHASNAIAEVNNAINKVSSQRASLGALQNRLDHKIANLDTSAENLQAAESRIRDLDMAKEMTAFTKNNILSQASTAMLAQANSLPQGVLQLLQ